MTGNFSTDDTQYSYLLTVYMFDYDLGKQHVFMANLTFACPQLWVLVVQGVSGEETIRILR